MERDAILWVSAECLSQCSHLPNAPLAARRPRGVHSPATADRFHHQGCKGVRHQGGSRDAGWYLWFDVLVSCAGVPQDCRRPCLRDSRAHIRVCWRRMSARIS